MIDHFQPPTTRGCRLNHARWMPLDAAGTAAAAAAAAAAAVGVMVASSYYTEKRVVLGLGAWIACMRGGVINALLLLQSCAVRCAFLLGPDVRAAIWK